MTDKVFKAYGELPKGRKLEIQRAINRGESPLSIGWAYGVMPETIRGLENKPKRITINAR